MGSTASHVDTGRVKIMSRETFQAIILNLLMALIAPLVWYLLSTLSGVYPGKSLSTSVFLASLAVTAILTLFSIPILRAARWLHTKLENSRRTSPPSGTLGDVNSLDSLSSQKEVAAWWLLRANMTPSVWQRLILNEAQSIRSLASLQQAESTPSSSNESGSEASKK